MTRIAALQMVSTDDLTHNLNRARLLIEKAADQGATLAVLPENFALFSASSAYAFANSLEKTALVHTFLQEHCQKHRLWICAGSLPTRAPDKTRQLTSTTHNVTSKILKQKKQTNAPGSVDTKVRSTCFLLNADGEIVARYDKMHLFDAEVADAQGRYRESDTFSPGDQPVVAKTPLGTIGLAICYDLRFPELFRAEVRAGADVLLIPSAFTAITGAAHWQCLLRARAIENQCYVVGCNQGGRHSAARETFGGSTIIDPWGSVLQEAQQGETVVIADISQTERASMRARLPALTHQREITTVRVF